MHVTRSGCFQMIFAVGHVTHSVLKHQTPVCLQGNAHMTPDGPLCQHGPVECQMNRKMSCFNFYHTDQSLLLQYAACSEGHSALDIDSAANKCIKALGVDLGEIRDCEDGTLALSPFLLVLLSFVCIPKHLKGLVMITGCHISC